MTTELRDFMEELGVRRTLREWLAWRLVRMARRLHCTEYVDRIVVRDAVSGGEIGWARVRGDAYGCGVDSAYFPLPGPVTMEWEEDVDE